jgi:hypothetical protein
LEADHFHPIKWVANFVVSLAAEGNQEWVGAELDVVAHHGRVHPIEFDREGIDNEFHFNVSCTADDVDDTCFRKMVDQFGIKEATFDERKCPDQIILGANDPNWCILIHMAVYLEAFLAMHPGAKYLFTNSLLEISPNNLNSSWQNPLKKVVWFDPRFKDCQPELDEEKDGGKDTHSIQKISPILHLVLGVQGTKSRFVEDGS